MRLAQKHGSIVLWNNPPPDVVEKRLPEGDEEQGVGEPAHKSFQSLSGSPSLLKILVMSLLQALYLSDWRLTLSLRVVRTNGRATAASVGHPSQSSVPSQADLSWLYSLRVHGSAGKVDRQRKYMAVSDVLPLVVKRDIDDIVDEEVSSAGSCDRNFESRCNALPE